MIVKPTSLGKIAVTTAGTIVQVSSSSKLAQIIQITTNPGNTGKIFIGLSNMVASTRVGVIAVLSIPTVNILPYWLLQWPDAHAEFDLQDLWLDADVNGESAIVSYVNV
jgi:hypothetical protein